MEKSQFGTTSFCFSPQPHRHLKSETYRSLIRILSHCYDHSPVSAPQEPIPEIREQGELVGPDCAVPENEDAVVKESFEAVGFENKGFGDMLIVNDEIDHILGIEENDDFLKRDPMTSDIADGTGSQDMGFDRQQMLMDELEHIVKGNGELVQENTSSVSAASMDENQSGEAVLMNDPKENVDFEQIVNEKFGKEAQLQVEKIQCNLKISEPVDFSVDRSMHCQLPKPSDDSEGGCSLLRTNAVEVEPEMRPKETVPEKLVHADGAMDSHNYVAKDVDVEEKEVSGGFEVDEASIDMLFKSAVLSEEKKDGLQVSEYVIDKREISCDEQNRANEIFSDPAAFTVNHANIGRAMELKESFRNDKQCESKNFVHGTSKMATDEERYTSVPAAGTNKRKSSGDEGSVACPAIYLNNPTMRVEVLELSATEKRGITSEEKLDSSVRNKKKRSAPSKDRKAKKKQKERKKRAEKNRQLGVKRLKLRPVLKPKTLTYCRHYLMGRCQEADKCKFSHDAVPLTKSKPCCHFARNSCMKGDDCPFDHQLFKYPCNNFVAKGFCNRGGDCMFSHKVLPKEDGPSTSSASKHELKLPSLVHMSNSQKQANIDPFSHQNLDALSNCRKVSSCKNTEQNVAVPVQQPAVAPKGVSCLFFGKSSVLESSKLKQGSSSPKRNGSGKVGNQTEQTALSTVQNMNEIPKRTPPVAAPKGVNFLSFGNTPVADSGSKKLASLLLSRENGVKSSLLNNFGVNKQAGSSHNGNNVKVGNQKTQTMSSATENSNEMLKKTDPAFTPQGLNFLSIRKALTDDSISNKQASLPSSSDKGINRLLEESQNTPNEHQNSTAIPRRPLASLLAVGHSSDLACGHSKGTPNSSQRALMSTLAFAAKIETERKINLSALSTGSNNQTRDDDTGSGAGTSGGLLNDLTKVRSQIDPAAAFTCILSPNKQVGHMFEGCTFGILMKPSLRCGC
ncbi:hypothetical protein Patl1_13488 [Pistacia atlantica]|uniref:Uncharacterized protein n=1 Tax=Pistacia atlantica TaxID=434234 RepID=A0ACC1ASY5_9ROSI|nr:hypothetical protein Patl1_13488 [Pistacia atlantica]